MEDIHITAEDRDGRPVLMAKATYNETTADNRIALRDAIDAEHPTIPFAMIVDPGTIWIYRRDGEHLEEISRLDAAEVISHYSRGYTKSEADRGFKPIFRGFLTGMTTAWLSDLAERWKEGEPPKLLELDRLGLLERLAGGTVTNEELMRDRSLS